MPTCGARAWRSEGGVEPPDDDQSQSPRDGPVADEVIGAEQRHEGLRLSGGCEDAFALGDVDDLVIGRVDDQQRTSECGDVSRLVVDLEVVEERRRDRKRPAADDDRGGPLPADVGVRVGDEPLDGAG
jgi:hypothetical protein